MAGAAIDYAYSKQHVVPLMLLFMVVPDIYSSCLGCPQTGG